jgi:anti-sigma factor RsiW
MTHEELESLLGAYALDAVGPAESAELDAHLAECPRCRAEVDAHREMAAMIGGRAIEAPAGLWEKIAHSIVDEVPRRADAPEPVFPGRVVAMPQRQPGRLRNLAWTAVAGVAAAAIAVLGVEVDHLGSQVNRLRADVASAALAQVISGPHRTC